MLPFSLHHVLFRLLHSITFTTKNTSLVIASDRHRQIKCISLICIFFNHSAALVTVDWIHFLFFLIGLFYLFFFLIYFFGCVGSSFLCEGPLQLQQAGATPHRGARASHHRGLSRCGAQAPDAQAQQPWLTGPVAPWHVGSSRTRARTHVPHIGGQIPNHCATREAPLFFFLINLLIYFWLRWVFVAVSGLSLVAVSGGYSLLWCAGFSFLIAVASLVAEHRLQVRGLQ